MAGALTRSALVLAKVQSAEGSEAVPKPQLNALLVSDMSFRVNGQPVERNFLRASLSALPYRLGRKLLEANFSMELKAGPDLGMRPEWSPLLRAGGMQETRNSTLTSLRTAALKWTTTAAGTGEFYVELAAAGDPSITDPDGVLENGEDMTRGVQGSLRSGQFCFGTGAWGFSTIIVRLSDDADPDSKALDFVQKVVGTTITYVPRDSSFEFATIYLYPDGLQIKMIDSIVDWNLNFRAGQTAVLQVRAQSIYTTPTDVAIPTTANFQSHLPEICGSMGLSMASFDGVIESLQINSGVQIAERLDLNSANGFKGNRYVGRTMTGSFTPEQELEATHTFWAKYEGATEMALDASLGTTPKRFKIEAPDVQYSSLESGDRGGIRTYNMGLRFNEKVSTGEKEIKFTCD